jgi:agmatinase
VPRRTPWFDLETDAGDADLTIVGVPFDGSVSLRAGAADAPARMRQLSTTSDPVDRRGRVVRARVRDLGDVAPGGGDRARLFAEVRRRVAALPGEPFVVGLGGDNSVSIPLLQAFADRHGADVGVIWFDAHPDLFERYDGDPDSHACALRRAIDLAGLSPDRVVLLGTRSYARLEVEYLAAHGIEPITAADWRAAGNAAVVARTRARLERCRAVYWAVDIDGFDAGIAPGTGYPMPAGVAAEDFFQVAEGLFAALPIRAMDITEIAPKLDVNDITTFLGIQIVLETAALLDRTRRPHSSGTGRAANS